jgi:acetyl esterase/lipase
MKSIFALLVVFSIVSGCNQDLNLIVPKEGVEMTANALSYQEKRDNYYGNSYSQQYDLYLPNLRNTRNPVIVLLHGGAWRLGDKSSLNFLVNELKAKRVNCAIVNANYRLANGSSISYQQQIEDIDKLLKKVASQSKELGISSKFLLVGMSAGGHLSMLYSQTADTGNLVAGVCGIAPPVDLTTKKIREGIIGNDIKQMIGKSFNEAPEEYRKASPLYQAQKLSVPTLLFYGGKDAIVTPDQSIAYKSKIRTMFTNNEYVFYPDQTHDWSVWSETLDIMIRFAESKL